MQTTVHNRQTLADLALQECGAFEAAFGLALRSGLALTDDPRPGTVLDYAAGDILQRETVAELALRGARPATAPTPADMEAAPYGGIGYMGIEIDFNIQ